MFGLTKREQYWAAQERGAKMLTDLAALALQVRLAEARAQEAKLRKQTLEEVLAICNGALSFPDSKYYISDKVKELLN